MKDAYEYTMTQSDFWKYIVDNSKVLLKDMDTFQYSEDNFIKKISSIDQQFLSFIWAMKFIAYEEEIVDSNKKSDHIEEVLGIETIDKFVKNKTEIFKNLMPVNSIKIIGPDYVLNDEIHNSRWVLSAIKNVLHTVIFL